MNRGGREIRLLVAAGLALCLVRVLLSIPFALSQTAPTVDSASVDGSTLTIAFSESLTSGSTAVASDFTVTHGEETIAVSSAAIDGSDVSLTLMEAVPDVDCSDEGVTVGYSATSSSLVGTNGGTVGQFSDQTVTNATDAAPEIESIESDATGRYIYVTFCEAIADLSYQWSDFSAFTVSVDGNTRPVNDLLRRSATPARLDIQLSRSRAIADGETVTLAYDQRHGNASYPLGDLDQGNKRVASWSARSVTNNVDGPPTLQSVSALYDAVTLTFSEELDEGSVPDESAFTIGGVQNAPAVDTVSISGETVTLGLDAILHSRGSPTYTLNYSEPNQSPLRQFDGAHHVADIRLFQFTSSTPDKKPEVEDAEVDGATLTITFDLPLKAVAPASAFSIGGDDGIEVTASSFNGSVVTLTIAPAATSDASITVSYSVPGSSPRIEARNNRDADAFSDQTVTNKTAAPVPEFSRSATSADGSSLTVDFTLALDTTDQGRPAVSSFSLSGTSASVSSVAVSGSRVTLGLQPLADVSEVITVSYRPPGGDTDPRLRSSAHQKAVEAFSGQSVSNDTDGKPRPVSATVDGDDVEITFDRGLDDESEPASSAFTIDGVATTVSDVSIDGQTLTLTISPGITHLDTITVDYTQLTETPLKREGRSLLVDSFSGQSVLNETGDPTPTFASASVDATGRTLTVVMSHPLLATATGTPAASAFTLSGTTQAAVDSVSISGSNVLLRLDPAVDLDETISVSYEPPSDSAAAALQSTDGQWKASAWSDASATNGADGVPRLTGATANGSVLTLTFDRALDEDAVPPKADFSIVPSEASVSEVNIDDQTVTLTLSAELEHDDVVSVAYSAADMVKLKRDGRSLTAAAFSGVEVENETPEPLLRSVAGDEQSIVLTFSASLDMTSTPDTSAFSLGADQPTISGVTVNAMTVDLTLDRALSEGSEYTLTYTAPTESALRTSEGVEIPGFSASMTNATDVAPRAISASGDGSTVTIGFDQTLDGDSALSEGAFGVTADRAVTVTAVSYMSAALELTLSRGLVEDESASISYTEPEEEGIADPGGNRTESFSLVIDNQTDTAPVPVSGTVEADAITIILDQELYEDPRFELEAGYPSEHFSLGGTDATIDFVTVSNGGEGGVGKVVITLSREIAESEAVSITYFPATGSIRIRDDDAGQNRAQISSYALKNLNDHPPVVVSATVNGTHLVVTFDQALDGDSTPDKEDLSLSNSGPAISTASISEKVLTLTLSTTAIEDAEYTLTYTPPASGKLRDLTGNEANGFTVDIENATDYAPFPVELRTDEDGRFVYVVFDQRLQPDESLDASLFTFEPQTDLHSVIIDTDDSRGATLKLILREGARVGEGVSIQLEYEPPSEGGLQDDDAPNRVSSFSKPVDNRVDVAPRLVAATVNRSTVSLSFDQSVDPDHVPPANCEQLQTPEHRSACHGEADTSWFSVLRDGSEELEVQSVEVAGSIVSLTLSQPVGRSDTIQVGYSPESLGDGRYNLRDTSSPAHLVERFDHFSATNLTAAAALGAVLDRAEPDRIDVTFDGELSATVNGGMPSISVSVDGAPIDVESVSSEGSEVRLRLVDPVPECAVVALSYVPGESPLLDVDDREVIAFGFDVANLIDADWGLRCIRSDAGALLLTFRDISALDLPEFDWLISVNEEDQTFSVGISEDVLVFSPAKSICEGDLAVLEYVSTDSSERFQLQRQIGTAAPCAMSATADGVMLRVRFDGILGGSSPDVADFTISGRASLEAVEGVQERRVTLRLTPPGLHSGEAAEVSYHGDSLVGRGLTVGPFVLPVLDATAAPELVSAFAVDSSIFLTFDQPLLAREVPASRFILAGPGIEASVESVFVGGSSVYLELSESLPDDPDLFALVYRAGVRGGLAGLTGVRVKDSVFLVQNFTETPPSVRSAAVDSSKILLTFDQPVEANGALPSDFLVSAGRRAIEVESLSWLSESVTLTLAERVTSLDAVAVRYAPGEGREVRDRSKLALESFEFWVENQTSAPTSVAERLMDARLRSGSGETTLARELARGFASEDGVRAILEGGTGWSRVVRGDVAVSVDAGRIGDQPAQIEVVRIDHLTKILEQLEGVPSSCWTRDGSVRISGWLIGASDLHGVPTDLDVRVRLSGAFDAFRAPSVCVMNLVTGEWGFHAFGRPVVGPALVVIEETPTGTSREPLPLAG